MEFLESWNDSASFDAAFERTGSGEIFRRRGVSRRKNARSGTDGAVEELYGGYFATIQNSLAGGVRKWRPKTTPEMTPTFCAVARER